MTDSNQLNQVLLKTMWRSRLEENATLPTFDEVQFRAYSQNGEDGILLYIFSLIGTLNKQYVEICAGNGEQCNCANLTINHGWRGLMLDGDAENVKAGRAFYAQHPDTFLWPPTFVQAWITRQNVNEIVSENGISGEIDLLSLDIDGNDYWILEALDVVQPRVIVAEYQNAWGPDISITQRYQDDFSYKEAMVSHNSLPRCGASLSALAKLAKRKGYRLVGCERYCFNAFFVKDGIGEKVLPEVKVADCFFHPMAQYRAAMCAALQDKIPQDFWQEV